MHALPLAAQVARQVLDDDPQILTEALRDDVNLAVWRRTLDPSLSECAEAMLAQGPLAWSEVVGPDDAGARLAERMQPYAHLPGAALLCSDLHWLVEAFACLTGAQRIGMRLRGLDRAMCPRWHVDHVPLRLITTYVGLASLWSPDSEPDAATLEAHSLAAGDVGLFKGEKWSGNEGRGILHRSPSPQPGEQRLLLTLDWLSA
ncbi:MAG: hypothetical protein GAK43_00790 [Stenotrophomonas maltophilia]|nr:MAG: hypothetical protein GAK43_00790 [Stenotrophomonas maltophilia]